MFKNQEPRSPGSRFAQLLACALLALCLPLAALAQSNTGKNPPPKAAAPVSQSKPDWKDLNTDQQSALRPLEPFWADIEPNRKRKWIAMSANFSKLPASDQATLHGRMREWASLSTAERNRARLNFAQTKELSAKEKRAQWEAYQALSPEQKRRLAAQASPRPAGAAPAVTPRGTGKLASVPVTRSEADGARSSGPELRAAAPERTASQP